MLAIFIVNTWNNSNTETKIEVRGDREMNWFLHELIEMTCTFVEFVRYFQDNNIEIQAHFNLRYATHSSYYAYLIYVNLITES